MYDMIVIVDCVNTLWTAKDISPEDNLINLEIY